MTMTARKFASRWTMPLLLAGAVAGCTGDPPAPPAAGAIGALTLAADSASNPTVAYAAGAGKAYTAWIGREDGQNAVFVASIDSTGVASKPARANDIPGDAAPHLQAPAQVAVGPQGAVYVLWQNNTPVEGRRFPASDLRLAVSNDGGRSFRPAVTVNDDAGGPPSSHTFHDMVVGQDGTVYVSWIDSRERDAATHQRMTASGGHAHSMAPHAGMAAGGPAPAPGSHGGEVTASHDHAAMAMEGGPEIRVARSLDGGRTFEPSVVVDTDACPCCRTALELGPEGEIYVAWRKIFAGDVRDVVVARAEPGTLQFAQPVRVHQDEWVFPGCPHAGPSLAVAEDGRMLVGWYTGKEGRQGLWYALSDDGGRSFGAPGEVLSEEWVPPSQVRLAIADDRVWAAWGDRTGERPVVRVATGAVGAPLQPLEEWTAPGGDPSITATADGALLAWLDGASAKAAALTGAR